MAAFALAGCDPDWTRSRDRFVQANTTVPASYRTDILAFMRTYLNDPTGVKDAFLSEPELRGFEGADRYSVCMRYTARGTSGQYAAAKDSLVLFRDGRLDRMVDNGREICKDAKYQPFPELERLPR